MSNPITAASSSTTRDITVTSGLGRAKTAGTAGIPRNCSCGERIVELISKSRPNQYCRYYRCLYADSLRLENDDHIFKWVDETFTDEIRQLHNQVRILEEEVQLLKATIRSKRPTLMPKISGGCVHVIVGISVVVVVVADIIMYK
ncbi:uncharacterized protein At4g04775-like [Raphanus sativus]|uniref:Uncharacterized protein At4g04775-like n=1 Tax=Raphanus sativus TaxID=3726 RepID=A0A6J0JJW2_RAPSA|nr:uncharacterized protein At4g04775-like [Raphanus sativus]